MKKRLLAFCLALCLALSLLPMQARAASNTARDASEFEVQMELSDATQLIQNMFTGDETRQMIFIYYGSDRTLVTNNVMLYQLFYQSSGKFCSYVSKNATAEAELRQAFAKLVKLDDVSELTLPVAVVYKGPNNYMDVKNIPYNEQFTSALQGTMSKLCVTTSDVSTDNTGTGSDDNTGNNSNTDIYKTLESEFGIKEAAWEVLRLTNRHRMDRATQDGNGAVNREPLSVFKDLETVANTRAEEIYELYLANHMRPDGTKYSTAYKDTITDKTTGKLVNITYHYSAENIASGQPTSGDVVNAWIKSPGHHRNMDSEYPVHLGVGYYYGPSPSAGKTNWVENFAWAKGCYIMSNSLRLSRSSITMEPGKSLEQLLANENIAVYGKCIVHGDCALPLIAAMCSGDYDPNNTREQTLTVSYLSAKTTLTINGNHEHTWVDEIKQPATCIKTGVKTSTCSNCGATMTEGIPITESHKYETNNDGSITCSVGGENLVEGLTADVGKWPPILVYEITGVVTEEMTEKSVKDNLSKLVETYPSGYDYNIIDSTFQPPRNGTSATDFDGEDGWYKFKIEISKKAAQALAAARTADAGDDDDNTSDETPNEDRLTTEELTYNIPAKPWLPDSTELAVKDPANNTPSTPSTPTPPTPMTPPKEISIVIGSGPDAQTFQSISYNSAARRYNLLLPAGTELPETVTITEGTGIRKSANTPNTWTFYLRGDPASRLYTLVIEVETAPEPPEPPQQPEPLEPPQQITVVLDGGMTADSSAFDPDSRQYTVRLPAGAALPEACSITGAENTEKTAENTWTFTLSGDPSGREYTLVMETQPAPEPPEKIEITAGEDGQTFPSASFDAENKQYYILLPAGSQIPETFAITGAENLQRTAANAWTFTLAGDASGQKYTLVMEVAAPEIPERLTLVLNGQTYTSAILSSGRYLVTLPAGSAMPSTAEVQAGFHVTGASALTQAAFGVWTFTLGGETYTLTVAVTPQAEESLYISIPQVTGGEIVPSARRAAYGERVTLTAHPDAGYELVSISAVDSRGREIFLRSLGNGGYIFTMPAARVTVRAVFEAKQTPAPVERPEEEPFTGLGTPGISGIVLNPAAMPFTDVPSDSWYYNSVEYMWKHYLMTGVSDTRFAPGETTSRAMIWSILARMSNVRTDINPGSVWYERGMLWAMEQGVTDGANPLADITREQLAVMLWRKAGYPAGLGDLSQFSDSGSVSSYAVTAVRWAVFNGILNGSDGKINPKGTATRAEVAAMVARYGDKIAVS